MFLLKTFGYSNRARIHTRIKNFARLILCWLCKVMTIAEV